MSSLIELLVLLPVVVVWILALRDVLTRRDVTRSRRVVLIVVLVMFVPLTILYLLGRPPSSVRRGRTHDDDPRASLVRALDQSRPTGPEAAELLRWVRGALD